jgi:putative ABC transport system substrate-binding protein
MAAACISALLIFLSFGFSALAAEKTIGVVLTGNIPYYKEIHKAFIEGLNEEGVLASGKYDVVLQTPSPELMSWTNSIRKLAGIGSVIIVCYGAPATLVAVDEAEVPVVFAGVYNPQALGISSQKATGVSSKVPVASILKSLKSIANFTKLGIVFNEAEKDTVLQANEVKQLEATYGYQSVRFSFKKSEDTSKISNVDALFITTGCSAMHCVQNIVDVARKAKIPTASMLGGGEMDGIILTLTADPAEQGREAAKLVSRILKGEKPAALPIVQPKKIDLVINLKEATALNLKVPFDLLTSATKVIK